MIVLQNLHTHTTYCDGIDTPEKVEAADEKRNEGKLGQVERSFDTNDFFEAALKRSYET